MTPVVVEMTAECPVCGEVACERDMLWVDDQEEADILDVHVGDAVCRDCAGGQRT